MIDAILSVHLYVPTRPTAFIELGYVFPTNSVNCVVYENSPTPKITTNVARFNDVGLEFNSPRYETSTQKYIDSWKPWQSLILPVAKFKTEKEFLCYRVLLASDVFCASQAHSDFRRAIQFDIWDILLEEMRELFTISSVMFT